MTPSPNAYSEAIRRYYSARDIHAASSEGREYSLQYLEESYLWIAGRISIKSEVFSKALIYGLVQPEEAYWRDAFYILRDRLPMSEKYANILKDLKARHPEDRRLNTQIVDMLNELEKK